MSRTIQKPRKPKRLSPGALAIDRWDLLTRNAERKDWHTSNHVAQPAMYTRHTEPAPLHRHATVSSPVLNPHASKFSQMRTRTYRQGLRLNCQQPRNDDGGANMPVKLWRRTNDGKLTFDIDC